MAWRRTVVVEPWTQAAAAAVLVLAAAAVASAADVPAATPAFSHLPSQSDDSALTMACEGRPPYQALHCRFTEVAVRRQVADAQAEQKMLSEMGASWERMRATLDGMCPVEPDAAALAPAAGSPKAALRARALAVWKDLCACRDAACVRRDLEPLAALGRGVCRVSSRTFELEFVRAGAAPKWVSLSEPTGPCRLELVATLELDPSDYGRGERWTYSETHLAAQARGDECKGIETGATTVFSWRADGASLIECSSVEFGL